MTAPFYNSHVTVSSPFGVADLPTLFCWRQRVRKLNGEPEEDLNAFMDEHLARTGVLTWAAYRDGALGAYFEAVPGSLLFSDSHPVDVARVDMEFKRDFFDRQNGTRAGGHAITRPALNLVLHDLFQNYELAFFVLQKTRDQIRSIAASVGSANAGLVDADGDTNLLVLSRMQWETINAGFIAEYEAAHPEISFDREPVQEFDGMNLSVEDFSEPAEQAE